MENIKYRLYRFRGYIEKSGAMKKARTKHIVCTGNTLLHYSFFIVRYFKKRDGTLVSSSKVPRSIISPFSI